MGQELDCCMHYRRRTLAGNGLAAVRARADLQDELARVEKFYAEALAAPVPRPGPLSRAADALGLLAR